MNIQILKNKKLQFIFGVIITIFIYIFFNQSMTPNPTSTITITDTARKNRASGGTDLRIIRVKINGEEIPFEDFGQSGNWEFRDGVLMVVNPSEPALLTYQANSASNIEIDFQKHDGSGIVSIEENGKILKELDLYSPEWSNINYFQSLGNFSISIDPPKFIFLLLYIESFILLIPYFQNSLKGYSYKKSYLIIIFLFFLPLCIKYLFYSGSRDLLVYYAVLSNLGLIYSIGLIEFLRQKHANKKTSLFLIDNIWIFISGSGIFFITAIISHNLDTISIPYVCGNIFIYISFIFIFYMLIRRIAVAVSIVAVISCIFASANYFVDLFRGTPITPGDFLSAGTAATVFTNYKYEIPWEIALAIWLTFMLIFASFYLFGRKKAYSEYVLCYAFPSSILLGFIWGGNFYTPSLNLWDLNSNIEQYGLAMSFISNLREMHIAQPYGYSAKDSGEYLSTFVESSEDDPEFCPNIIAIMNESFSDISIFSDQLNNSEFLSYFYSLQDNVVRGNMLVYPLGGGTANTEYEFLTGNSMSFLSGTVPYQQFVLRDGTYSIAQVLKHRGYHTIGIHPYDKKGYSRYKVYPLLGFDEFLDIDSFNSPELVRGIYPSDHSSYEKVIEQYEQNKASGEPLFIFNVTMQNHSGYETDAFGDNVIRVPGHEGEYPKAEEYLTLIKKSDEALPTLINYFSSVEEPTILVFFGDHQPALEDEFYETMIGKPFSEWTLEEWEQQYTVPFLIWANFDIPTEMNVFTSANYLSEILFETAGMKLTPYQSFLKYVQAQVPAINGHGFLDSEGIWHPNSEVPPILNEYWHLQYRNMFDKKIHY